jgi:outer membrane immunogenic protein
MGVHAGGAWSQVDWADVSLTGEPVTNDGGGFIGGAQVGYNFQFGSIVAGAEATISGSTIEANAASAVAPATITYTTDIHTIATAFDRVLVYAKGGWAGARVAVSGVDTLLPDAFTINEWRSGWTVGGGAELRLSPSMSVGIEYSYIDLGNQSYASTTFTAIPYTITDHDVQIQSVTARLNFKLQREEYVPLK